MRKIVRNLHKPVTEAPKPPPPTVSKRGRTLRPKINLNLDDEEEETVEKGPRVFETWCPEVRLNYVLKVVYACSCKILLPEILQHLLSNLK